MQGFVYDLAEQSCALEAELYRNAVLGLKGLTEMKAPDDKKMTNFPWQVRIFLQSMIRFNEMLSMLYLPNMGTLCCYDANNILNIHFAVLKSR